MKIDYQAAIQALSQCFWPLMRIGGVFLAMPWFSSTLIPTRIRMVFAFSLAVVVAPFVGAEMSLAAFRQEHVLIIFQELLLGVFMGFILQIVFQVFVLLGQIISMQAGLGFATMVDPATKASVPLVSQFYLMLMTLLFLTLNGHLVILDTLIQSFRMVPVGQYQLKLSDIGNLMNFSGWMFQEAVLVSLPAIFSLLLVNLAFGVVARVAPQLNIFTLGFPVTLIFGMMIISLTFPAIVDDMRQSLDTGFQVIKHLFG